VPGSKRQPGKPAKARTFRQRRSVRGKLIGFELSRDAAALAALADDKSCRVCDVATGRLVLSIERATTAGKLRLSHDGNETKVWDILTGQEVFSPLPAHGVKGLMFSPDGSFLAIAGIGHEGVRRYIGPWPAPRTDDSATTGGGRNFRQSEP
jgi:WD40 repeat protein